MLKVTAALLILGSFACYLLWDNEEKLKLKVRTCLKKLSNQLRMLSYLFKKLNKISLLHRINNLGIQDYCLLNNLLTEIL